MKVSATEEYGLRCLMHLAKAHRFGATVTTPDVDAAEGLPPHYAAKLLVTLRRAGLVQSVRGVKGGVRLARPPEQITIADAFAALSGTAVRTGACMSPDADVACSRSAGCGLRDVWATLTQIVTGLLSRVTLADLIAGRGNADAPGSLGAALAAARKDAKSARINIGSNLQ